MSENVIPTESNEIEIDLLSLLRELIRKWYIIAAAMVCFTLLLIVYSLISADRRYTSSASAYLLSKTDRSTAITTAELNASATLAADFAQILENNDTLKETASRLDLPKSAGALKEAVSVSYTSGNRIVTLKVKDQEAAQAQKIAETLLAVAGEKASAISKTISVEVVDKPTLPASVSRPGLKSPLKRGVFIGFILACAYIVIQWFVRKPIWSETDMEDYFKAPSLGSVSIKR